MVDKKWEKPEIEFLGDAEKVIKNIDVDGVGDSIFPQNLASS